MKRKELLARPIAAAPDMSLAITTTEPYTYTDWAGAERTVQRNTLHYKYTCLLAGEDTLETTVYAADGQPICRTWQSGTQIISQTLPDGKGGESMIENLYHRTNLPEYNGHWYTRKFHCDATTTEAQQAYFDAYELQKYSGITQIERSQRLIRKNALKERNDRIRKSIDDDMLQIRPVPKAFEEWTETTALKFSRYLFYRYKKGAKAMQGWCSHCRQPVTVTGARHKQAGRCPNCKSPITYIAEGRFSGFYDKTQVAYLQKTIEGCCIRQFEVARNEKGEGGETT